MRGARAWVVIGIVVAMAAVAAFLLRPRGAVIVTIANDSAQRLRWVAIEHPLGGERVDDIGLRVHRTLLFRVRGKSDITVRARFDDGREVALRRVHAEPGDRFRFAVRDTGIDVRIHP